jgi:hypothetical protein
MSKKRSRNKRHALVTAKVRLWTRWQHAMGTPCMSAKDWRQARTWFELLFAAGHAGLPIACFGNPLGGYERAAYALGQVCGLERRRARRRLKSWSGDHGMPNRKRARPCL